MPLGAFWGGLELKNRRVLKNSGNFLSNEHKNFIILLRNGWEKQGQRYQQPTPNKKINNTKICAFSDTEIPCFQHCVNFWKSPKKLRSIFYQMDHIWWAPNRPKKSPGPKMESQLSHTFGHSLIATLYVRRNRVDQKIEYLNTRIGLWHSA